MKYILYVWPVVTGNCFAIYIIYITKLLNHKKAKEMFSKRWELKNSYICDWFSRNHRRHVRRGVPVRPGQRVYPGSVQEAQAHHQKDGARPHRPQREAAQHSQDLLLGEPQARRADEGAAGRDDRPQSQGHQSLVPEQALQGKIVDGMMTWGRNYTN